jgi:holin-like protein
MMIQFITILAILLIGNGLSLWLSLPLPGSILGMLLLFVSLLFGIFKLDWVEQAAQWFIRHFTFLLIPSIVGVLHYIGIFQSQGLKLAAILVTSSLVVFLVTAHTAEYYENKKRRGKHENINS